MNGRQPNDYAQIRIMLREMRPYLDPVNPYIRVMGKDVYLDIWTEFDVTELRESRGESWWGHLWENMLGAPGWEIWGRPEGGEWEPLSEWLLDGLRRKEWEGGAFARGTKSGASAPRLQREPGDVAEWMQRVRTVCVPKPGLGEAARHLVDHAPGYREEVALLILRMYEGREEIYPADLRNHLKNGRKRSGECRFCSLPEA